MKISTKFRHTIIRLRHSHLKLRVQKPKYYQALASLMLVFAVGGVLSAYFLFAKAEQTETYVDQFNLEIQTYSVNGDVTEATVDSFKINAAVVIVDHEINRVEFHDKTVRLKSGAGISTIKLENSEIIRTPGTVSDIKIGASVIVYTSSNPSISSELLADQIEIIIQLP